MTDEKRKRMAKGSKRSGQRGTVYFVGRPGSDGVPRRDRDFKPASKLPLGIWQRTSFGAWGSAVKPIAIFVKRPSYRPRRLPFHEWAQAYVDVEFPKVFARVAAETLRDWSPGGVMHGKTGGR